MILILLNNKSVIVRHVRHKGVLKMAKLKNNLKFLTVLLAGFFNNSAFSQENDSGDAAGSEEEAKASSKGQLSAGAIAAASAGGVVPAARRVGPKTRTGGRSSSRTNTINW